MLLLYSVLIVMDVSLVMWLLVSLLDSNKTSNREKQRGRHNMKEKWMSLSKSFFLKLLRLLLPHTVSCGVVFKTYDLHPL